MKKINNVIFVIVVSTIIISIFLFSSLSNKQKLTIAEPRKVNKNFKETNQIRLDGDYDVIKRFNDSIFVTSWESEKKGNIYFINEKERKVENYLSFGNETIVSNFFQSKNQNDLIVLNTASKNIIISDKKGKIEKNLLLDFPIARGSIIEDEMFFLTWGKDLKAKHYSYNIPTSKIDQIKSNAPYIDQLYSGIKSDGVLEASNGRFYLTPYAGNKVFFFNSKLEYVDEINLIYDENEFNMSKLKNNEFVADPNNLYPNIHSSVYNNSLYILTNETGVWDENTKYFIDVYDIKQKKYKFSFLIQDNEIRPREILTVENKIYVLGKNKLNIYEIK